ncbi:MAG: hypothetical protein HWE24_06315 [Oceanospirillaceae bacterium]|nr:hypothetical protein [Oceanospirillaceae bacterium]
MKDQKNLKDVRISDLKKNHAGHLVDFVFEMSKQHDKETLDKLIEEDANLVDALILQGTSQGYDYWMDIVNELRQKLVPELHADLVSIDKIRNELYDILRPKLNENQFDQDKFLQAIEEWNEDKEKAESKYGPLKSWDLSSIEVFGTEEHQQKEDRFKNIIAQLKDFKEYYEYGDNSFKDITMNEFMKMLDEKVVYIIVKKDHGDYLYYQIFKGAEEELGVPVKEGPETGKFDVDLLQNLFLDSGGWIGVGGKFNPTKPIYCDRKYYYDSFWVDDNEWIKESINEAIDNEEINVEDFDHLTLKDFSETETFYQCFEDDMRCEPDGSNGEHLLSWWMSVKGVSIMSSDSDIYVFVGDKKINFNSL